ncbi:hypothetical protein [Sphingopyxis granuli]|uniref:hypothetical protein n=1 Tax=Sphingopyxis granuli TaxID=267128 RepID=UPI0011DF2795|nr:hypothetical protein [Sphingopyxis granuli]
MRYNHFLTCLLFPFVSISVTLVAAEPEQRQAPTSATEARDINGLTLGDHITKVRERIQLSHLGGGDFEGHEDETYYRMAFTPLGRLYHIESTQPIGRFSVDAEFLAQLGQRLTSKYGPSKLQTANPWRWGIVEPVTMYGDINTHMETNWAYAMLGSEGPQVTLQINMLDFRILWSDQAKLNRSPKSEAQKRIRF